MSLLYDNEGDARFVVRLQLDTGLSDGGQLVLGGRGGVKAEITLLTIKN